MPPLSIHAYLTDEIVQLEFIFKNNKKHIYVYIVEPIICERHCAVVDKVFHLCCCCIIEDIIANDINGKVYIYVESQCAFIVY